MQRFLGMICVVVILVAVLFLLRPDADKAVIKVGILHSLSGTMAVSEQPVMQASLLAIEQINAAGGVLGHQLEAVVLDGQSDDMVFSAQAERLITQEHVEVLFGCWTSGCRKSVKKVVEKHDKLLFYPLQYEGLEQSANIIYMGAAPNQQMIPAVNWALQQLGKRVYLVGSDYVFPHVANWLMGKQLKLLNGELVAESYVPLGSADMQWLMADIKAKKPEVIINTINGDSNVAFFKALQTAGFDANNLPVISLSVAETELAQIGQAAIGHYGVWSYFNSIESPENEAFIQAYKARFGDRLMSDPMQSAWVGVQLWAKSVANAGSFDTESVRRSLVNQSILAPEGVIAVDRGTYHAWRTVRVGKVIQGGQFKELWSSKRAVRPVPYPLLVSKHEASEFLATLYQGWGKKWAAKQVIHE
ncbi:MAG: urea ABC transporter substrate-binding protein [Mariprofundaceae bacterium]